MPCSAAEISSLFLFEKLSPEQIGKLCAAGRVEQFEPGPVYTEGEPAACFYVMIEGTVVLSRRVGGDDIEVSRTSQRGVYAGSIQAYLGDRVQQVYINSMRVTEPTRFFVLPAESFADFIHEWFPMAVHLLEGLTLGSQTFQRAVGQRERLLALGSLSAGLTHELNNPAAAAVRATSLLRDRVAHMRNKLGAIASGPYHGDALKALADLQERTADRVSKAPALSPLEASDREDELADWLDDHGVQNGWQIAPTFVQGGLDVDWLEQIAAAVDEQELLQSAIECLTYTVEAELLMSEIEDSTTRISHLVDAAKQYSQLDRALPGRRCARTPRQHIADAVGQDRSTGQGREGVRPFGAEDSGLPGRTEPGVDQPDRQRSLRHQERGRRRDVDRTHRSGARPAAGGVPRHGPRSAGRDPRPDLRPVLHHQTGGRGHRAGARHLLADRRQQAPR
jgi:signal transduction histidine kinase